MKKIISIFVGLLLACGCLFAQIENNGDDGFHMAAGLDFSVMGLEPEFEMYKDNLDLQFGLSLCHYSDFMIGLKADCDYQTERTERGWAFSVGPTNAFVTSFSKGYFGLIDGIGVNFKFSKLFKSNFEISLKTYLALLLFYYDYTAGEWDFYGSYSEYLEPKKEFNVVSVFSKGGYPGCLGTGLMITCFEIKYHFR